MLGMINDAWFRYVTDIGLAGPDKGWSTILRLCGPLEPWYDKTWRPGEIEMVR